MTHMKQYLLSVDPIRLFCDLWGRVFYGMSGTLLVQLPKMLGLQGRDLLSSTFLVSERTHYSLMFTKEHVFEWSQVKPTCAAPPWLWQHQPVRPPSPAPAPPLASWDAVSEQCSPAEPLRYDSLTKECNIHTPYITIFTLILSYFFHFFFLYQWSYNSLNTQLFIFTKMEK